jgi:hypothetical protein
LNFGLKNCNFGEQGTFLFLVSPIGFLPDDEKALA